MTGSSTRPTEGKTVQASIRHYAQDIGRIYVPREEAERRRRFLPHPNPLPEDGAREMMEHQLMTAQIRVHYLDLDEILAQAVAEISDGTPNLGHAHETGVIEKRPASEDEAGTRPFSNASNSAMKGVGSR